MVIEYDEKMWLMELFRWSTINLAIKINYIKILVSLSRSLFCRSIVQIGGFESGKREKCFIRVLHLMMRFTSNAIKTIRFGIFRRKSVYVLMSENNKMIYGSDVHFSDLSWAARAEKCAIKTFASDRLHVKKTSKADVKALWRWMGKR
jgi:hypothetical protein